MDLNKKFLIKTSISVTLSLLVSSSIYISSISFMDNHFHALNILYISLFFSLSYICYLCLNEKSFIPSIFVLLYLSFICIVPAIYQTSSNIFPWKYGTYDYIDIYYSSFSIFLFIIFFISGQIFFHFIGNGDYKNQIINSEKSNRYGLIFSFVIFSILLGVLNIWIFGIDSFIGSRGMARSESIENMSLSELGIIFTIPKIFIGISFFMILYLYTYIKSNRSINKYGLYLFLLSIFFIPVYFIIRFPGSLSRMTFFGTIIIIIMLFVSFKSNKHKFMAVIIFSVGILTIFPVSQSINRGQGFNLDVSIPNLSDYMKHGDFDGMQTNSNAIIYANEKGHTYGNQILSAFLFFIPRKIWNQKGNHTGKLTAKEYGYFYSNISTPIFGELYIDFGFFGIIIGGFIIGIIYKYYDNLYNSSVNFGINLHRIIIANFSVSTIFLMRGSLLGVFGVIAMNLGVMYFLMIYPNFVRVIFKRS